MRSAALPFLFLLSALAFGQQHMVGISGGFGASRLHGNTVMHPSQPITSLQCNQSYTRWYKSGFGIQAQITATTMGGKRIEYMPNTVAYIHNTYQYSFSHLGISVGAAYRTPHRLHGVVALGFTPSFIVFGTKYSGSTIPHSRDARTSGIATSVNRVIIFGYGALGAGFHFKGPVTLGLLARYDHGLNSISKPFFFKDENLTESCWTVAATLAFRWPR